MKKYMVLLAALAMSQGAWAVELPPTLDSGDTAWILVSTVLVLLMTIPGLALFYGGMVRKKNVLATMGHSVTAAAVVTVVWVVLGYTLAANGSAAYAVVTTQVAAAAATLSWLLFERMLHGKASILGAASGAVAGLVVITPAAGFVDVKGALIMGFIGGAVCLWGTNGLKRLLKADDALDAFGLHAVGGIVGAILTALFASEMIMGKKIELIPQLLTQIEGVVAVAIYSAVMTFIIAKVIDILIGLRVGNDDERMGLDLSQHGERIE